MASLKDMRVRIASTKSTQKITKAMQMVAVSKLRRAQAAVEAARPYAERVETVLTKSPGRRRDRWPGPRRLLIGSGADQAHLLLVAPASAGWPVRSTRRSCGWRASGPTLSPARAKSQIFCVGRKGYEQLRRT